MTDGFILIEMNELNKNYNTLSGLFSENLKKAFKRVALPTLWKDIVQLVN